MAWNKIGLRSSLFATVTITLGLLVAAQAGPDKQPKFKRRSLKEIAEFLTQDGVHDPYYPVPPRGFTMDQVMKGIPKDNPLTRAKVELGRQLYFDPRLSKDGTVSCASCHHPGMGYSDNSPTSSGIRGQKGDRNAPTVINRLFSGKQFWDGRAESLEEQALGPIENPIEMGHTLAEACQSIEDIPGYRLQFRAVFGTAKVTPKNVAKAIAAFERTVLSGDSVYDVHNEAEPFRALDMDDEDLEPEIRARAEKILGEARRRPMSKSAKNGQKLFFGKAQCATCHAGANFTDELYHNIGVGMDKKNPDLGRYKVTGVEKDKGAFKTPGLRNIADNPPYMHDGSQKTLEEVVDFYNKGGHKNPWLSDRIKVLNLTDQEKKDLVEFMKALSGRVTPITTPKLP